MKRSELRRLFRRHHGSIKRVAKQIALSPESVSRWLRGDNNSVRVEAGVLLEAEKLLAQDAEINAIRANLSRATGTTAA